MCIILVNQSRLWHTSLVFASRSLTFFSSSAAFFAARSEASLAADASCVLLLFACNMLATRARISTWQVCYLHKVNLEPADCGLQISLFCLRPP